MCLLSFVLLFKLSYKCKYGESIYVVGNTDLLGNWNPNKALRLNWSEGHNWSLKVKLIHDNREPIQYKYIIAPTDSLKISEDIQWERGLNRLINFETTSKLCIQLNDEWEHRKVKIAVPYEAFKNEASSSQEVFCYTNLPNKKSPISMELKKQTRPGQLKKDLFWTASFMIPYNINSFSYKLRAQEIETKEIQNDLVSRKFDLKKFPYHASLKELYTVNCATFTKFDFKFSKTFNFDIVTEEIYLGSCPRTANDVKELLSNGVKAVLNLQTDSDMEKLTVNWESLKQQYQKANIVLEHFPIIDMNNADLAEKVREAAKLIEKLVKNNGKLYVHCSAGKYRSPHAVIFYLWYFKKYDLAEAIKLIKSKRVKTRVNIYQEIFKQDTLGTR